MKTLRIAMAVVLLGMLMVVIGYAGTAQVTIVQDPDKWSDGSPATITGHNIYYGTTKGGPYPNKFPVGVGTNFSLNSLPTGSNYIVVTPLAKNLAGAVVEGPISNEGFKLVDDRTLPACTISVN